MQFYYHDLTVERILEKIYDFQKRTFEGEKNQKADLVAKILRDVIEEICSFYTDKNDSRVRNYFHFKLKIIFKFFSSKLF